MTPSMHSILEFEAGLCLWEAMIKHRYTTPALDDAWRLFGTVEMRDAVMGLVQDASRIWEALDNETRERLSPYDWEFTPMLLDHVDWHNGGFDKPIEEIVGGLTSASLAGQTFEGLEL